MVVLGEIIGSYGVRGWVRVRPFSEVPDGPLGFAIWWLRPPRGSEWREFAKTDGRMHSGAVLAGLRGVETREAALALKGFEIGVPREALPTAPAGEIYWDDLTGFAVVNRAGVLLGEVRGLVEHGAHPLLRVARPADALGPERLIPYVPAIVDKVDVGVGTIEVDWGADF